MMPVGNRNPRAYKWVTKPSRDIPDDLLGVAETLESNRPQLSGLEADAIKLRAMAQGARPAPRTSTKGMFMRSRLAITAILAFGLLMTGSGAALGVSALSTSPSASVAQYGDVAEGEEVAGTAGGAPPAAAAQASRQLESDGSAELPFTGYAAVPTLLIGIGLLAMGLILRRNPGRASAQS
jgi:hypothetical protein